jgi:predicted enzyme related to lactoylglutathione lyase
MMALVTSSAHAQVPESLERDVAGAATRDRTVWRHRTTTRRMRHMRRTIAAIVGLWAAVLVIEARAEVTVMAVRIGASDVVALAKFYDAAFGLKEIDRVGNPATEIIMRWGATVAEAKAGASPEFLVQKREGVAKDPMHHAIFRVTNISATVAAAKAAGATVDRDVSTVQIGGAPIKIAMLVDPQGNALEIMELSKSLTHLPH